jgi:cytochrome c peroxidase
VSNVERLILFLTVFSVVSVLQADEPKIQHRRPVAAVAMDDHHIFVANRRSGTISEIDVSMNQVVREFRIGQHLTDLKRISADRLACIDQGNHELILLRRSASGLDVESRTPVSPYPVSLQVDLEQNRISVASLWARSLTIFDIANTVRPPTTIATIRLSFAPGQHLLLPKYDKAVVADAFGGKLAVVDLKSFQVESVRELPAHNIRHLAWQSAAAGDNGTRKPERIVLAHQFGNHLSRPTQDDIHWGMFLNNGLRTLQLNVVLDPRARLLSKSRFEALGDIGRGAGDPSGFVNTGSDYVIATLSGVNAVVIVPNASEPSFRVAVGIRPIDIVALPDGRYCVINTLSDSVSLIGVSKNTDVAQPEARDDEQVEIFDKITVRTQEISLGPAPVATSVERGERLFFDAGLSHDTWFSCHSCHPDGHSNGQLADTLTDGDYGAAKRVLSLRGVGDTGPWAWNGKMKELTDQMHKSVHSTMQGPKITDDQARDLAAFIKTFKPIPTIEQTNPQAVDHAAIVAGAAVFESRGCITCHAGSEYTSPKVYDVGLKDELGTDRFNPPSLRGVRFRDRLLHDARAESLSDVFMKYGHQLTDPLTDDELKHLIAYLESL